MKTININGKTYELHTDDKSRYTYYMYKGELLDRSPYDTRIIGYVTEGKDTIAICKKIPHKLYKGVYAGTAALAVVVCGFTFITFNLDIDIPEWTQNVLQQEEKLDDGVNRVSPKMYYSEYVTYSDGAVSLFVSTKQKADIAVTSGGITSEWLSADDCYSIPIELNLEEQGVTSGTLLYRVGDTTEEYPLIIERLESVDIQLEQGERTEVIQSGGYILAGSGNESSSEVEEVLGNVSNPEEDFSGWTVIPATPDIENPSIEMRETDE